MKQMGGFRRYFGISYKHVHMEYGSKARAALLSGISTMAEAVATSLGPGVYIFIYLSIYLYPQCKEIIYRGEIQGLNKRMGYIK